MEGGRKGSPRGLGEEGERTTGLPIPRPPARGGSKIGGRGARTTSGRAKPRCRYERCTFCVISARIPTDHCSDHYFFVALIMP